QVLLSERRPAALQQALNKSRSGCLRFFFCPMDQGNARSDATKNRRTPERGAVLLAKPPPEIGWRLAGADSPGVVSGRHAFFKLCLGVEQGLGQVVGELLEVRIVQLELLGPGCLVDAGDGVELL